MSSLSVTGPLNLEGTQRSGLQLEFFQLPSVENPEREGKPLEAAAAAALAATLDNLRTFASLEPFNGNNPEVLDWPNGTKLYWEAVSGIWGYAPTVRLDAVGDPNGHPANMYYPEANLGALIGISETVANGSHFLIHFSRDFLRTYVTINHPGGGTSTIPVGPSRYWQNITGFNLRFRFYINDVRGTYGDNHGTIAHSISIIPLS